MLPPVEHFPDVRSNTMCLQRKKRRKRKIDRRTSPPRMDHVRRTFFLLSLPSLFSEEENVRVDVFIFREERQDGHGIADVLHAPAVARAHVARKKTHEGVVSHARTAERDALHFFLVA